MPSFEEAWKAVAIPRGGQSVSHELRPLLQAVYSQVLSQPLNVEKFRKSLEELLNYLSREGRTNANCWATDLFFANAEEWEGDWVELDLPEELHDVLAMMGQALHDTVQAPEVAENFGCLPEQLLETLRQLPVQNSSASQMNQEP